MENKKIVVTITKRDGQTETKEYDAFYGLGVNSDGKVEQLTDVAKGIGVNANQIMVGNFKPTNAIAIINQMFKAPEDLFSILSDKTKMVVSLFMIQKEFGQTDVKFENKYKGPLNKEPKPFNGLDHTSPEDLFDGLHTTAKASDNEIEAMLNAIFGGIFGGEDK